MRSNFSVPKNICLDNLFYATIVNVRTVDVFQGFQMSLQSELKLDSPFKLLPHEAMLNVYYCSSCLKKTATAFFKKLGLTDVQFNVMMLLYHQDPESKGLSQARISEMMLVNRANVTTLIDRMEKGKLVERVPHETDRRFNLIRLTDHGIKLLEKVDPLYGEEVQRVMGVLSEAEQKQLIAMLEKVRDGLG